MSADKEEKDAFERLFNSRFKDWEVPPPPDAWAKIKGQINQPKWAWADWKVVVPIIALLFIAGTSAWYISSNVPPTEPTAVTQQAVDQPEIAKNTHQAEPQTEIDEQAGNTLNENKRPEEAKFDAQSTNPQSTSTAQNPKTGTSTQPQSASQAGEGSITANTNVTTNSVAEGVSKDASGTSPIALSLPSRRRTPSTEAANANHPTISKPAGDASTLDAETKTTNGVNKVGKSYVEPLMPRAFTMPDDKATNVRGQRSAKRQSRNVRSLEPLSTTAIAINPADQEVDNSHSQKPTIRHSKPSTQDVVATEGAALATDLSVHKTGKTSPLTTLNLIESLHVNDKLTINQPEDLSLTTEKLVVPKTSERNPILVVGTRGKAEGHISNWAIDVYLMPHFSFRRVEAGLDNEMQVRSLENKNQISADRIGYEAGARVNRLMGNLFELNMGLHVASINEELVYNVDHSTPAGLTQTTTADGSMMITPTFLSGRVQQKSAFYYGGLNLGSSIYLAASKRLRISGGAGVNWLMRGNTSRVHNGAPKADFSFPDTEAPFQQVNMHLYAGFGYVQPITSRISIMVEPTLNFFLFSTYQKREPVTVTPTTMGLNLMLRYKL